MRTGPAPANLLPPVHYLEHDLDTEWYKDGITREVAEYSDGTANVIYPEPDTLPGSAIDFLGETRRATTGPTVDRYSTDVTRAATVRLRNERTDPATGAKHSTHYYVSSEHHLMLIDDNPDPKIPFDQKPLRPVRFDTSHLSVTLGEEMPMEGVGGTISIFDGSIIGGQSGKKTRPITSAMLFASYTEPYKQGWQKAVDSTLPHGDVPRRDMTEAENPLAAVQRRFTDEHIKLARTENQ